MKVLFPCLTKRCFLKGTWNQPFSLRIKRIVFVKGSMIKERLKGINGTVVFLACNSEASATTKVTSLRPRSVITSSMQTDITYLKALVYISPYDMVTITFTRAPEKERLHHRPLYLSL